MVANRGSCEYRVKEVFVMKYTNDMAYPNPCEASYVQEPRGVVVRAGLTAVQMVGCLVVMAVLCLGMIWIMSAASR